MIHNQEKNFPNELWNLILNYCSFNSLNHWSKVSWGSRNLSLNKLKMIKVNTQTFVSVIKSIQELYVIKYRNLDGPPIRIDDIGKYVFINMRMDALVLESKVVDKPADLEGNQLLIIPTFGKSERSKFLLENNPGFPPSWFGLSLQAFSIAQDKLPIQKITIKSKITDPTLLLALKRAEQFVNKFFCHRFDDFSMEGLIKTLNYLIEVKL